MKEASAGARDGLAAPHPPERIEAGTPEFRRTNIAVFFCGFAIFAVLYCPQPVLPLFVAEFGVSPAQSSLAVSVTAVVMAVAMLFASSVSEAWGRKVMMLGSLILSSALTLALWIAPNWDSIVWLRALAGIALSGAPAVTLAYLGEEMAPKAVPSAVGLYIRGSALGGMSGRLAAALVSDLGADHGSWRLAMGGIGIAGLICALLFWRLLPASRHFKARELQFKGLSRSMLGLLATPAIFLLVLAGFCLLGSFMTLYNYLGFRLQEAPFNLSPGLAGLVFLAYPLGSLGSAWLGALASKWGRGPVLIACSIMMLMGLAMMTPDSLIMIGAGLALMTFSFFGAHAICAGWAPAAAAADKAQASSLYLLLYYIGGGVAGSAGGIFWASHRWDGVALFSAIIMAGVLVVALALSRTSTAR